MRIGSVLAIVVLLLVAFAHLLRLVFRVEIVANGVAIPFWVSILGVVIPGTIAGMLWRESTRRNGGQGG